MMERYLRAADVAETLQVSTVTARAYIRGMRHMEKPLRVSESVFQAWLIGRLVEPIKREPLQNRSRVQRGADGKYHLPRWREV